MCILHSCASGRQGLVGKIMGIQYGKLAAKGGEKLALQVLKSGAGYYIGTACAEMGPFSRESKEYFKSFEAASEAFENSTWTQRMNP